MLSSDLLSEKQKKNCFKQRNGLTKPRKNLFDTTWKRIHKPFYYIQPFSI